MTQPAPARPRATWPLYLVAALAFIPGLGFILGSIAVSWGLVSSRPGARRAVALAASGALLNILGMLLLFSKSGSGTAVFRDEFRRGLERNLGDVVLALEEYQSKRHSYPESLQDLQRARGPLHAAPILDYGPGIFRIQRPFQYMVAPDGLSYDLFSVGPDGKPGTTDDIRPTVPDSLRGRIGLKPTH